MKIALFHCGGIIPAVGVEVAISEKSSNGAFCGLGMLQLKIRYGIFPTTFNLAMGGKQRPALLLRA